MKIQNNCNNNNKNNKVNNNNIQCTYYKRICPIHHRTTLITGWIGMKFYIQIATIT